MSSILQKTIRGVHQRLRALETREYSPTEGDPDAIHDNIAGEIILIAEKVAPANADVLVIEDSAAANIKKRVQIVNLPGGADPNAIHVNVAAEIAGIAPKAVPIAADLIVIEDSAAANAKKSVQVGNLPGGADPNAIHVNVAAEIAGIAPKAVPIAADLIVIEDSAAANVKKSVQIGNLPGGAAPVLMTGSYLNAETEAYSAAAFAWKGNFVKPTVSISIHALAAKGDWPQGITLKFGVFTVAAGVVAAVVYKSAGITLPNPLDVNPSQARIWEVFSPSWDLAGGTLYLLAVGRSDGADNYALPISNAAIKPAPFSAHENATGSGRIAKADPLVGDAVDTAAATYHILATWEVS